jgi:hypothetical protein
MNVGSMTLQLIKVAPKTKVVATVPVSSDLRALK